MLPDFAASAAADAALHARGNAHVHLAKYAGDAVRTDALAGRLYFSRTGWLLLSVPNALGRGAFDALDEAGVELPVSETTGQYNAHVTVMRPDEVAACGGPQKITERGHSYRYTLGPVKTVEPKTWSGVSKVWYITVDSPELKELRRSYGLSDLPNNGKHEFHATFAIRKKRVLNGNEVSKAAHEAARVPRQGEHAGVSQLAGDGGAVREPEPLPIQGLRREGCDRLSKVAAQLLSLLGRHGSEAAWSHIEPGQEFAAVRADELCLVGPENAGEKQAEQPVPDLRRREAAASGVVGTYRAQPGHDPHAHQQSRHDGGTSAVYAQGLKEATYGDGDPRFGCACPTCGGTKTSGARAMQHYPDGTWGPANAVCADCNDGFTFNYDTMKPEKRTTGPRGQKAAEKRGPAAEYCPHCDARLERDSYSGTCNRCGKDWPAAKVAAAEKLAALICIDDLPKGPHTVCGSCGSPNFNNFDSGACDDCGSTTPATVGGPAAAAEKLATLLAHVGGASGAGKTTLLGRLGQAHPGLVTQDLDDQDDEAVRLLGYAGTPKSQYTDAMLATLAAKRQELLDAFLAANQDKPVVLGGHHTEGPHALDVPTDAKYLLDTGPLTSAWRAYRRSQTEAPEHRRSLTELPGDYLEARRTVRDLRAAGYAPKSPAEIEAAVTAGAKLAALLGARGGASADALLTPTEKAASGLFSALRTAVGRPGVSNLLKMRRPVPLLKGVTPDGAVARQTGGRGLNFSSAVMAGDDAGRNFAYHPTMQGVSAAIPNGSGLGYGAVRAGAPNPATIGRHEMVHAMTHSSTSDPARMPLLWRAGRAMAQSPRPFVRDLGVIADETAAHASAARTLPGQIYQGAKFLLTPSKVTGYGARMNTGLGQAALATPMASTVAGAGGAGFAGAAAMKRRGQ